MSMIKNSRVLRFLSSECGPAGLEKLHNTLQQGFILAQGPHFYSQVGRIKSLKPLTKFALQNHFKSVHGPDPTPGPLHPFTVYTSFLKFPFLGAI